MAKGKGSIWLLVKGERKKGFLFLLAFLGDSGDESSFLVKGYFKRLQAKGFKVTGCNLWDLALWVHKDKGLYLCDLLLKLKGKRQKVRGYITQCCMASVGLGEAGNEGKRLIATRGSCSPLLCVLLAWVN